MTASPNAEKRKEDKIHRSPSSAPGPLPMPQAAGAGWASWAGAWHRSRLLQKEWSCRRLQTRGELLFSAESGSLPLVPILLRLHGNPN
ncbi:hypothetical protein AAFF_G00164150 [Aldrovandia affinis]|uniref:Uncharacterized protein n=1 Tax=Aldrovandia affinis TaxID=143900 RepID=A0AAD7T0M2_9TELE|nr:hypothetical protein AAFF_G00164150 [Aldrovandia affinis]